MGSKAMAGIYIVIAFVCIHCCSSSKQNDLETHSIFYGFALTAANRKAPASMCVKQLAILENGVRNLDRWAIKMMDASGVPNTGLYWGNTYWMGSKKQCVASVSTKQVDISAQAGPVTMETPDAIPPFAVDYYAAYFNHNSTMQVFIHWRNETLITLGLCIPTSCQESEVEGLLQEYFDSGVLYHQSLYNMSFQLMGVKKVFVDYSWLNSTGFMITGGFIGALIIMCIFGTVYDSIIYPSSSANSSANILEDVKNKGPNKPPLKPGKQQREKSIKTVELSIWGKIFQCFSLSKNIKEILCWGDTKPDILQPICGMRLFTTVHILMSHSIAFMADQIENRVGMYYTSDTTLVQVFINAHFCVDTFFTIGGFLVSYIHLKGLNKKSDSGSNENQIITLIRRTTKRFLRITPAYMAAICLAYINATWRYRETAFWSEEKHDVNCAKYWWKNLLYINNFSSQNEICLIWSWYLTNDMQFYILCTALILLSTLRFKLAAGILGGIFTASCAYIACFVYSRDHMPLIDLGYLTLEELYYSPFTRICPYIIGVITGYILHYFKGKLPISKDAVRLLWIVAVTLSLLTFFSVTDRNISLPASTLYMALSRSVWSLSIAWMILACVTDNGGIFQEIVSYKCWMPFSNVSYCTYLTNPIIIYAMTTLSEKPWQLEASSAILFGLAFVTLSFTGGFILTAFVEYPFIKLVKTFTNF